MTSELSVENVLVSLVYSITLYNSFAHLSPSIHSINNSRIHQFYKEVQKYRQYATKYFEVRYKDDPTKARRAVTGRARVLFDRYIIQGCELELNLPDTVRSELLVIFKNDGVKDQITQNVFNRAQAQILNLMKLDRYVSGCCDSFTQPTLTNNVVQ